MIRPTMQQRVDSRDRDDALLNQFDSPLILLSQFDIGLQDVLLRDLIRLVLRASHIAKLSQRLATGGRQFPFALIEVVIEEGQSVDRDLTLNLLASEFSLL